MSEVNEGTKQNEQNRNGKEQNKNDFFRLSKTCGQSCSIILIVFMIVITICFFAMLIYCKYYRKSPKKVQNIVVQVKAIQINQSILNHVRSLSQQQMERVFNQSQQSQQLQQLQYQQSSLSQNGYQLNARTSVQIGKGMDQEYKNYLQNEVLSNIKQGKQLFENDSVQFVRYSQMKNYFKDQESSVPTPQNDNFSHSRNRDFPKDNEMPISQQNNYKDNQNNNTTIPRRFVKSEQSNYQITKNSNINNNNNDVLSPKYTQKIDISNTNVNQSAEQKQIIKKSGIIINDKQNNSMHYIKSQKSNDDSLQIQFQPNQQINQQEQRGIKNGKVKLASLYIAGNHNKMDIVKEEQSEINDVQNKNEQIIMIKKRKSILEQSITNDPALLDSTLNNSTHIADNSIVCNSSILNSIQQSCKNQNSKLLSSCFPDADNQSDQLQCQSKVNEKVITSKISPKKTKTKY